MPTYDYVCKECGPFEALRSMSSRDDPIDCPHCASAAQRIWLAAPRLAVLTDEKRHAMSTNEKASHEPMSSKNYTSKAHPSGCSCCSSGKKSKSTLVAPNGTKTFVGKRPWMISH
ncbi:Putative regulatory protein fmdB [Herminiimonas arsenicoxydans]|uniref:Regulatory protein fmdB n=1 Tax=Herminiimonas arsenicoxydans TaxID=204773 RepID=A4G535_HERAR|nr:Putative regulatory protein fmdB [Herminiimonas arsenicoxydans]